MVEVRPCTPEQFAGGLAPLWHYFGVEPGEEAVERLGRILAVERVHAAFDGDAIVGGAGAYSLEVTVPGGPLPTAGVMAVGVLPTHRRRGILTELMRCQLDDVRRRGEPVAMLWASEGAIYGRYGYGVASFAGGLEVAPEHAALRPLGDPAGTARLVGFDEALELFPQVYDRVRAETPGMLARSRDWWDVRRLTVPSWRRDGEQSRVVLELGGRPEGYAIYKIKWGTEGGVSASVLEVVEAIGTSAVATRELWRFLINIDWIATVHADLLPVDHPLLLLVEEPRRLRFTLGEALWVRLVDVGAALSRRSYAEDGAVVLEVADTFCPWNTGRWRLEGGRAERTEETADLKLGVTELGSVYLGGFTFSELSRAGLVQELTSSGLARADALFRTDRAPWCPEIF